MSSQPHFDDARPRDFYLFEDEPAAPSADAPSAEGSGATSTARPASHDAAAAAVAPEQLAAPAQSSAPLVNGPSPLNSNGVNIGAGDSGVCHAECNDKQEILAGGGSETSSDFVCRASDTVSAPAAEGAADDAHAEKDISQQTDQPNSAVVQDTTHGSTEPAASASESSLNDSGDAANSAKPQVPAPPMTAGQTQPAPTSRSDLARPVYHISKHVPLYQRILQLILLMARTRRVFRFSTRGTAPNRRVLYIDQQPDGPRPQFVSPHQLSHCMVNEFDVIGDRRRGHIRVPAEDMQSAYASTGITQLPQIERVAQGLAFDKDFAQLPAGYHPDTQIFVVNPVMPDAGAVGALRSLCEDFNFREPASIENIIGFLVAGALGPRHVRAPGLMIMADAVFGTTTGKTTLAHLLKLVVDGGPSPTDHVFPHDEQEFHKLLGGLLAELNERIITFDNVRPKSRTVSLENQTLEKDMTSPTLQVRVLGSHSTMARINDILFVCTGNGLSMAKDLANRFIYCNLDAPPGGTRKDVMADMAAKALARRREVLAEIAYMIQVWKSKGKPLSSKAPFRDKAFAKLVGGIMEANGYHNFLANHASALAAGTTIWTITYGTLANFSAKRNGAPFKALEWYDYAKSQKVAKLNFGDGLPEAALIAKLNKHLREASENPVELHGVRYTLHLDHSDRGNRWYLTEEALPGHDGV